MKNIILLLALLAASVLANAEENINKKYHYCEVFGIAGGAEDSFIQNLAGRILDKKELTFDEVCGAIKRDSYNFGQAYGSKMKIPVTDHLRWMKYQDFREKVMDSILTKIDY